MWRNYLASALGNLARNKLYAAINIVGLAIGMAAALLLALYIRDELTFDRFFPGWKDVYLVTVTQTAPEYPDPVATDQNLPYIAPILKLEFPEIQSIARVMPASYAGPEARRGRELRDRLQLGGPGFLRGHAGEGDCGRSPRGAEIAGRRRAHPRGGPPVLRARRAARRDLARQPRQGGELQVRRRQSVQHAPPDAGHGGGRGPAVQLELQGRGLRVQSGAVLEPGDLQRDAGRLAVARDLLHPRAAEAGRLGGRGPARAGRFRRAAHAGERARQSQQHPASRSDRRSPPQPPLVSGNGRCGRERDAAAGRSQGHRGARRRRRPDRAVRLDQFRRPDDGAGGAARGRDRRAQGGRRVPARSDRPVPRRGADLRGPGHGRRRGADGAVPSGS